MVVRGQIPRLRRLQRLREDDGRPRRVGEEDESERPLLLAFRRLHGRDRVRKSVLQLDSPPGTRRMAERMGGRHGEVPVPGLRVRPSIPDELVPGRPRSRDGASRRVLRRGCVPHGTGEDLRPPCRGALHPTAAASSPVAVHRRLRHSPHARMADIRHQRRNRLVQPRLRLRHAGLDARRNLQQVQCLVQLLQERGGRAEGTPRLGVPFLGHLP